MPGGIDHPDSKKVTGDVKTDLLDCLDSIQSSGTFASFGPLPDFSDPKVTIGDHTIPLPLAEEDARFIIQASHKAPFGKGTETLVDTSVRNTWEIDRKDFQLQNPEWQVCLRSIIGEVAEALGIDDGGHCIQAELYKMLLYEKGAMFKPHTDTEKIPGMFGTLVICLPSKHTGGAVKLQHGKHTKTFETESQEQSYVCWYSDVLHEVKEVTSGYRWVLTYNLAHRLTSGRSLSAMNACTDSGRIREIFEGWRKGTNNPHQIHNQLIYVLDHQYTDASLHVDTLKGADLIKARCLRQVCKETNFCFYLASLERKVFGSAEDDGPDGWDDYYRDDYDEDDEDNESDDDKGPSDHHSLVEELDRSLQLLNVIDCDGKKLPGRVHFYEDDVIPEDAFAREPDDEEYEGFTGNEGATATQWYRDTVIVLLPRENYVKFRLTGPSSPDEGGYLDVHSVLTIEELLSETYNGVMQDGESIDAKNDLLEVCRQALKGEKPDPRRSDPFYDMLIEASCLLVNLDLAMRAASRIREPLPLKVFGSIGTLSTRVDAFSTVVPLLNMCLDHFKTFHETYEALRNFSDKRGVQIDWASDVGQWLLLRLDRVMQEAKFFDDRDGEALVKLVEWQKAHRARLQGAVDLVKSNIEITPFVIGFLRSFQHELRVSATHADQIKIFVDLLRQMCCVFRLQPASKPAYQSITIFQKESAAPRRPPVEAQCLNTLVVACMELNLTEETNNLVETIGREARLIDVRDYATMLLPFLQNLKSTAEDRSLSHTDGMFRNLYGSVMSAYLCRYVGKKPGRVTSLSRPPVHCSCMDCSRLNTFLRHSTHQVERIAVAKARRHHLHKMIDSSRSDCSHETDRSTNPNTMVITKRFSAETKAANEWDKKAKEARDWIAKLGRPELDQLLLNDPETSAIYQLIPWSRKNAMMQALPRPAQGVSGAGAAEAVPRGVKRKLEIIDLTGDN